MDRFTDAILRKHAETTKKHLEARHFGCTLVEDEKEALSLIQSMIKDGDTVSVGGSMTLFETGVVDYLEHNTQITYLDRYHTADVHDVFRKAFSADVYITSTNALTMSGKLFNVDRNGNRVAAMIYGPKKVIVLAGINKIVKDDEEAIQRIQTIASPANCLRLNQNTPCTKTGYCVDCRSEARLCASHVVQDYCHIKDRIHV